MEQHSAPVDLASSDTADMTASSRISSSPLDVAPALVQGLPSDVASNMSTNDATVLTPSSDNSASTTDSWRERPVTVSTWHNPDPPAVASDTRLDRDEIIRQVEYYFSDFNLRQDAHLLGLSGGDGNGWVSLSEILSWKKMRVFKPPSKVKEILKQSSVLAISEDNKRIKRKYPLTGPFNVKAKVDPAKQSVVSQDKPWLTKNMLKPTGFEKDTVEVPLTPAQYAEECELYHPSVNISSRLEEAVNRFLRNKRMHQGPRNMVTKFMAYGGIDTARNQFGGSGLDKKSLKRQGADQYEIDRLTAQFTLSSMIEREFDDQQPNEGKWVVDFTGVAKGFLSSSFPNEFMPYTTQEVQSVCNILRTFYNYLLYHSVCPEYNEDLKEARSICDQAEHELLVIPEMEKLLPGEFNIACSTIFTDNFKYNGKGDWMTDSFHDEITMPLRKALTIFASGVCFFGTEEQVEAVVEDQTKHRLQSSGLKTTRKENMGLRIVGAIPSHEVIQKTLHFMNPMAVLVCERWDCPYAAPRDVPAWVYEEEKQRKDFQFLVPQAAIDIMTVGMHLVANVHTLDIGVAFIDHLEMIHASFYTYLPNEWIREWKEPGPPTEAQKRKDTNYWAKYGLGDLEEEQSASQQPHQDDQESDQVLD